MIESEKGIRYRFGAILADPGRLEIQKNGLTLDLEPKSLRVFFYLLENRDRVVSKDELIEKIWAGTAVTDNALTRVVAQLRKQLGDSARAPVFIETVATAGYRFIAAPDEPEVAPASAPPVRSTRRPEQGWLLGGLAVAVIIAFASWTLVSRTPAPRLGRVEQLTSSAAADNWPTFSPDGSQIAFSSSRRGVREIYVRSVAPGSAERQVTSDGQENIHPSWSPDGQWIAFASAIRGGIGIVPVSGGPVRYLTETGDSPRWSPDGKTIVYRVHALNPQMETTGPDHAALMLVNADGSGRRVLTKPGQPEGGHSDPSWLSDGKRIVFTATNSDRAGGGVWILDTENGGLQHLDVPFESIRFPIPTRDSRFLYFIGSGSNAPHGVWRIAMSSRANPQLVMAAGGAVLYSMAVAPDDHTFSVSQGFGNSSIWSLDLKSHKAKPLIEDRALRNSEPVFSADGSKIAWQSVRQGGDWTIFTANADGSNAAPLTPAGQNSGRPDWFGAQLTCGYRVVSAQGWSYWLSPLQGPPRKLPLHMDLQKVDRIRMSRDGTKIAAHFRTAAGTRIVVEDLATGQITFPTPENRNVGFPVWSRDGKWIVAEEPTPQGSAVVLLSPEGGPIQTILREPGLSFPHDVAPDNERISFAGRRNGVWNIYALSRTTRRVEQLTNFDKTSGFVRYPAWSPKDDQIVFEHNDLVANVYLARVD